MTKYPGLGRDLRRNGYIIPATGFYPIGACGSGRGAKSDLLPVRELAIMNIMERLTDKDDWHVKVFNDQIVSKWRDEALTIPDGELWSLATSGKLQHYSDDGSITVRDDMGVQVLHPLEGIMTETTFDRCIEELRSKALYYKKSGIVPTLDAYASVAKSDRLVSAGLHKQLHDAFETLLKHQSAYPDWHPGSNGLVQDLVHPSMYPLVYGCTKVIRTEVVGLNDAIDKWAAKGFVIRKRSSSFDRAGRYRLGEGVPYDYWSDTYQWLPSNVVFQDDGSVKLTSYINNLHPTKYPQIYSAIEKLIEASIPVWDQCLALQVRNETREGAGRMHSRFPTTMPDNFPDQKTPPDKETDVKWRLLRKPKIPEPAVENIDYTPDQKRLIDRFRDSGLQVIVKMASIELTPDKPEYPGGGWHVEGMMNENICATALYYVDSENITPSRLSFRMLTDFYLDGEEPFSVRQDCYHWMEQIYGTPLWGTSPCLQNYGSVETREGRLLAFPNVFQHRVSPFELIDRTKPGHRRFIALWLVDPNRRIISTANVPPQQRDWWVEAILGSTPEKRKAALSKLPPEIVSLILDNEKDYLAAEGGLEAGLAATLPPELMDMVRKYFEEDPPGPLMSEDEAKQHRIKLMDERGSFVKRAVGDWQEETHNFCEH